MSPVVVKADALRGFVQRIAIGAGVPLPHAALLAESLVAADLRGVDSHGVQLLPFYLQQIADGRVNPNELGRVVSESGAVMIYDGANGLGQVVANACCAHAVRLAQSSGVGVVSARESNHFGAAAYWGQQIAKHDCLALVFCNASPMVAPWQGREPRWGTNPICVTLPGPGGGGWQLDMATTTVAMGKIYKANIMGEPEIPPGWAMDASGAPTTSTQQALTGSLMPLGGYKGSGLAMMVEILCGVLSGGAFSTQLGGLRNKSQPFRVSQMFLAMDITRFMPLDEFTTRMRIFLDMVKSSAPAPGYEEVLVAGEPEWRAEKQRLAAGIPLDHNHWQALTDWARRYQVEIPLVG